MNYLEKIKVSNIRRFGTDVEIDIAKGATIILAPNGTGKTALFEALELALTGTVKRIQQSLDVIIKDKHNFADVRLEFNDNIFFETRLEKGQKLKVTNSERSFAKDADKNGLPFLLRLTHLLNQRNGDWFVQANSTDAGGQLKYLEVGKEAIRASSVITSAKKAANSYKDEVNAELDESKLKLQKWLELLERLKSFTANRPHAQIEDILKALKEIGSKIGLDKQIANDLPSVKSYCLELSVDLTRLLQTELERTTVLDSFAAFLQEYADLDSNSTKQKNELVTLKKQKQEQQDLIKDKEPVVAKQLENLADLNKSLIDLTEKKDRAERLAKIENELLSLAKQLMEVSPLFESASEQYNLQKKKLDDTYESISEHNSLQKRFQALIGDKAQIDSLATLLSKWEEDILTLNDLQVRVSPALAKNHNELETKLKKAQETKEKALHEQSIIQLQFNTLNSTSDIIRQSVTAIAAHLPKDAENCPVCTAKYLPEELQEKMSGALKLIDPELVRLAENLEKWSQNLHSAETSIQELLTNTSISIERIKQIDLQIQTISSRISQEYKPKFASCNSIDDSRLFLNDLTSKNVLSLQQLEIDIQKLTVVEKETLALLESQVENLSREVARNSNKVNDIKRKISETTLAKETILSAGAIDGDLTQQIEFATKSISQAKSVLENLKNEFNSLVDSLTTLDGQVINKDKTITLITSRLDEIRTHWSNLGLPNLPNTEVLNKEKENSSGKVYELKVVAEKLESLDKEITLWVSSFDLQRIEEEIKGARGSNSVDEYTNLLRSDVIGKSTLLKNTIEKVKTLNSFSGHLAKELETVNEYIRSINPTWTKLLRRIVIDPRFAETTLNSYQHFKKQHADVKVPLHGTNTLVDQVASEAQITDLQLTFLLSLALKYQWSNWPGLLLDDPTQHHDLVHASSVFDLLRDYIVDHNFQVVYATHDSVQAKFFRRKLENDGIDVNFYALKATSSGVRAFRN